MSKQQYNNSIFENNLDFTSYGGGNGERYSDGANNLALVGGRVDVILQGKHDRTQSDDIHDINFIHELYIF